MDEFEDIMLSEKDKCCMIPLVLGNYGDRKWSGSCQGLGGVKMGS